MDKINMNFEVEFFPEECCEECGDIIHNHFECPICKDSFAGTSIYEGIYCEDFPIDFNCEECNSSFQIISNSDSYEYSFNIVVKEVRNND